MVPAGQGLGSVLFGSCSLDWVVFISRRYVILKDEILVSPSAFLELVCVLLGV